MQQHQAQAKQTREPNAKREEQNAKREEPKPKPDRKPTQTQSVEFVLQRLYSESEGRELYQRLHLSLPRDDPFGNAGGDGEKLKGGDGEKLKGGEGGKLKGGVGQVNAAAASELAADVEAVLLGLACNDVESHYLALAALAPLLKYGRRRLGLCFGKQSYRGINSANRFLPRF